VARAEATAVNESARETVLGQLRRALGRGRDAGALRRAIDERLAQAQPNLIPARADLDRWGRLRLFTAQAEAVQTTVRRVDRYQPVPRAVASYLREHNLPLRLVMACDPALAGLDWSAAMLEVRRGRPQDADAVGLTTAYAGIAETGTLMLLSAPETPTLLAFLPETALVVLPSERILRAYEDALCLLREERGALPRSINFVTGPSRSGDIEQTLQLGAHGPRRLCVLLVDEPAGARGTPS
jgi:L-lactate dehydrogenase complex protein LldG